MILLDEQAARMDVRNVFKMPLVALLSAAALGVTIGLALRWSPEYIIVAALSLALTTFFTRVISRTVAALIASIGLVALVYAVGVGLLPTVGLAFHVPLAGATIAVWIIAPLIGFSASRTGTREESNLVDIVACWLAIAMAAIIFIKIDYTAYLLRLLIHVEDNQAWALLTTQMHATPSLAGYGTLGPVMQVLEGFLLEQQRSGLSPYNSTFSAYALAMILVPVAVAGGFRSGSSRSGLRALAFFVVAVLLVFGQASVLFSNYGHLSAIWFFIALIAMGGLLAFEITALASLPLIVGTAAFAGAVWFPAAPLSIVVIVVIGYRLWRGSSVRTRIVLGVTATACVFALFLQLRLVLGLANGGGLGVLRDGLTSVYASQGGTATLNALVGVVLLIAFVALSLLAGRLDVESRRILNFVAMLVGYTAAVWIGANLLKSLSGYGPVKVEYLAGWVAVVMLIAVGARVQIGWRGSAAVLVALLMFGLGHGDIARTLQRAWPGQGSDPVWLTAIQKAMPVEGGTRPVGCFSNDKWAAYFCTRWAGGLTSAGDGLFLSYRLQVVNEQDPAGVVAALITQGLMQQSDVIVLDSPDAAHPWGWDMIAHAGRVYDATGRLIGGTEISRSDRLHAVVGESWAVPARSVITALDGAAPDSGITKIVCYGGDVAEMVSCSAQLTGLLPKGQTTHLSELASGDGAYVTQASRGGALQRVAVVLLDPTKVTNFWQWVVVARAGKVYDRQGVLLDARAVAALVQGGKLLVVKDTRWTQPAQALVDALLVKPPDPGVSEIICYGSDPAEASACSYFATEQLGKKSSALPDGLVTGAEQTVLYAKAAGTLDDVVILALDLPPKEDLLPYQKVLFESVEAVYQPTPSGGLRRVPDSSW